MDCIIAHQVPLSMRFSRQEYWSGLPFHPPGGKKHLRNTYKNITGGALKGTQADDVTAQPEGQVTDIRPCGHVTRTQQPAGQI